MERCYLPPHIHPTRVELDVDAFNATSETLTESANVHLTIPTEEGNRAVVHRVYLTPHPLNGCGIILGRDFMRQHVTAVRLGGVTLNTGELSKMRTHCTGSLYLMHRQELQQVPTSPALSTEDWNTLISTINGIIRTCPENTTKITPVMLAELFPHVHAFYHHHHGHTRAFFNEHLPLEVEGGTTKHLNQLISACPTCQRNAPPRKQPHTVKPAPPRENDMPSFAIDFTYVPDKELLVAVETSTL
jgi:hypothetical protein